MQLVPSPAAKAHMLHASRGQRLIFGCPPKLNHLLVLVDSQADSNAALDLATELADGQRGWPLALLAPADRAGFSPGEAAEPSRGFTLELYPHFSRAARGQP
ncbi:MAG: hypothetical protein JO015_00335 [Verrucomicrobia bacterium]|nr:hypothetical protein [Verrucomicrobiota bacterium]